jgi:hypothetical protein
MKTVLVQTLMVVISLLSAFLLFEVLLRQYPVLISEHVLMEYPRELRREIATRLDLPVKQARDCIPSEKRHDGGPELCLAYPNFEWVQRVDEVDRLHGAQERVQLDGNGFCNIAGKARRVRNDVVFIGDSFTWCTAVQLQDTFAAMLEEMTGRTSYNLGFPGIGLYEYVELLRRYGLQYRPRVVVMGVYEGNDLRDGMRYWKAVRQDAKPGEGGGTGIDGGGDGLLKPLVAVKERSYSLNYVLAFLESTDKRMRQDDIDFRYHVTADGSPVDMNPFNADRDEVKNARRMQAGEIDTTVWDQALEDFVRLSSEYGFTPVVAYIPSAYTAYSHSVRFEDPAVGAVVAAQSRRQREYLASISARLGLEFHDLSDMLQQSVSTSPLAYYPSNVHLTATGHALVADALESRLMALLTENNAD